MVRRKARLIIAAWLLMLASVCVMVYAWQRLSETEQVYAEGDQAYAVLTNQVRKEQVRSIGTGALADGEVSLKVPPSDVPPQVEIPGLGIDFAALQAINPDATAWLYCPDTAIDYPVMQAKDYDYYLHHLPDGKYNLNGALFLDYNNPQDFSSRLNIIYGHNMKSGRMFGSLTNYKQQRYFEQHPFMYLYTADQGNYRVELLYGCVVGAGEWRDRAFMFGVNLPSLLQYAEAGTTFKSGVSYTASDRFVVLSTCSYEFNDARYVVIGVLVPEYTQ